MIRKTRQYYRRMRARLECIPKGRCRTIGFALTGALLAAIGLVMLILPGPGLLFLAIALAVLSAEFVWAQALVRGIRQAAVLARRRFRRRTMRRRLNWNEA